MHTKTQHNTYWMHSSSLIAFPWHGVLLHASLGHNSTWLISHKQCIEKFLTFCFWLWWRVYHSSQLFLPNYLCLFEHGFSNGYLTLANRGFLLKGFQCRKINFQIFNSLTLVLFSTLVWFLTEFCSLMGRRYSHWLTCNIQCSFKTFLIK